MCTPFGEDGNYIMFARATSGDRKNNNKFSPCSLRAIDPVLNNKARSPKGCFTGNTFIHSCIIHFYVIISSNVYYDICSIFSMESQ